MKRTMRFSTLLWLVMVALVIVGVASFAQEKTVFSSASENQTRTFRATATAPPIRPWPTTSIGARRRAARVRRRSIISRSRRAAPQRALARTWTP